MTLMYALMISAAFFGSAIAQEEGSGAGIPQNEVKDEFPLFWVCLGITAVGIIIALYVAYRRPDEFHMPGSTPVATTEMENDNRGNEPVAKRNTLNDDLEAV